MAVYKQLVPTRTIAGMSRLARAVCEKEERSDVALVISVHSNTILFVIYNQNVWS